MVQSQHEQLEKVYQYQQLISEATKGLYENILEVDLTHDRFVGEGNGPYLSSRSLSPDMPFSQAIGQVAASSVYPEDRELYLQSLRPTNLLKLFEKNRKQLSFPYRNLEKDKQYHWIELSGRMFYWSEDESVRLVLYRKNIDDEKRREESLHKLALRDGLTGLMNKIGFESAALDLLQHAFGPSYVALLILDVDHFKQINDQHGHMIGDFALKSFASVLQNQFRCADLIGRIGGDEFAIMLRFSDKSWLHSRLKHLVKALNMELHKDGHSLTLSSSIGVALCRYPTPPYDELFRLADQALYAVKAKGRNGFSVNELGGEAAEAPSNGQGTSA